MLNVGTAFGVEAPNPRGVTDHAPRGVAHDPDKPLGVKPGKERFFFLTMPLAGVLAAEEGAERLPRVDMLEETLMDLLKKNEDSRLPSSSCSSAIPAAAAAMHDAAAAASSLLILV